MVEMRLRSLTGDTPQRNLAFFTPIITFINHLLKQSLDGQVSTLMMKK